MKLPQRKPKDEGGSEPLHEAAEVRVGRAKPRIRCRPSSEGSGFDVPLHVEQLVESGANHPASGDFDRPCRRRLPHAAVRLNKPQSARPRARPI